MDLYPVPKSKEPAKIISVSGAGDWSVYIIKQYQFVNKMKSQINPKLEYFISCDLNVLDPTK